MLIGKDVYARPGTLCLGLIAGQGKSALLVDSGLEPQTVKKALRAVQELGLEVKAVVNTHSHADHCGGNAYLQKTLGAEIYASPIEAAIIENPTIEGIYLCGACPPDSLKTKFVLAQPTEGVRRVMPGKAEIAGREIEIVPLPGHMPGQIGVACGGALFFGDALMGRETWDKYRLIFLTDVRAAVESCDVIAGMGLAACGTHTGVAEDAAGLAAYNKRRLLELADEITLELAEPLGREGLLGSFTVKYGLSVTGSQFYLLLSTVTAYLVYLESEGRIICVEENGALKYRRI